MICILAGDRIRLQFLSSLLCRRADKGLEAAGSQRQEPSSQEGVWLPQVLCLMGPCGPSPGAPGLQCCVVWASVGSS